MSTEGSNDDRRHFSRVTFDADTVIRQGEHAWSVVLIDLCLKGLLVEEPFGWDIESEKPLTASIHLNDQISIDMEVVWRHTEDKHIGFECTHIDLESISHLRRLVELNLGDSSLLERELASLG